MRRFKWLLAFLLILMVFSTGCGQKDVGDIVEDIDKTLSSLKSYKSVGTMKIQTGENPQEYSVEVWYKEPHYYRIALNNVKSQITQIVLRNDDGVFVLDPSLNKSYRFKSDWPESNGAVYLFHSLASSIIDDGERLYSQEEDIYQFEVKANYQNKTLTKQKIWMDKDLKPIKVVVFDPKQTQIVEMSFTEFEFDVDFDNDAFDTKRNLSGWGLNSLPAMANPDNEKSFGIIEPSYIPNGITRNTPKIVNKEEGKSVVIKYTGEFNYNLVESRPKETMVVAPDMSQTKIVDLDFGIGILTEMTDARSLSWIYEGVDFKLTGDLPANEMILVAKSVLGQSGK